MTTLQFLHHLRELGIQLWAEGDRLRFTAPQGALTDELRSGLSGRKQEILRLLRQAPAAATSSGPGPMPDEMAASGRIPLSFSQQRLWFLQQLDPASAAYNISRAMLLSGPLRVDLLERSLAEVVRRHAVLRTTFAAEAGEPFQVIAPAAGWRLPLVDLRQLPEAVRWAEMQRLSLLLAEEPMDLARGPLLRVVLLHLGAEEHVAAATLHHIVGDGWSTGLLFREMGVVYGAFARGLPSPLPELPIQYADYAWWQRQHLAGEVLEGQLGYWKEQLTGAPEVLELPTDRPRSAARSDRSDRGGRIGSLIPRDLVEPLKALGQAEGAATLFMVLLAGFDALLYRCSGQEDMVVGFPIANRNRTEVEGLIGLFINTLVLRTRLAAEQSWRDLLGQVRQTTLGAYAHQDLPFEKLVEELRPERQLSQTPLFQVTFSLQNAPGAEMQVGSFHMSLLPAEAKTAQFDLTCDMKETAEGVDVSWRYREELFDRPTVLRLTEQYLNLLADVASHPDRPLAGLVLLSAAERHQLLAEWSELPAPTAPELPLHALFEEQAALRPGEPALVWDGGRLSYGELDRRANRLARHLRDFGVGAEVPVAFCLERSPEAVVTILAILKAGGAYVPLDPAAPMERLGHLLDDAGAPVVVTTEHLAERLPRTMAILVVLDELAEDGEAGGLEPAGTSGDSLAYVMYTSGSTGSPKGVAVVHRAVARLVRSGGFATFGPEEAWAQLAPLSFDASTLEVWGALLHGGRLVLLPELPDPAGLGEALARHGVTSLWLTAGLFHQVVEENPAAFAPLSQLLAGGDVLSPGHVRRALAAHPGLRLINGYGPTENTTFTCCGPLLEPGEVGWSVPLGRPIGRTRVHVLDAALQPVPIGVEGELYAGGDGLARGYHGRPELTAERFVPDPWSGGPGAPGDRLYRTGDRVRFLADGRLEFLGRADRQVKVRGFRIEPQEIEAALSHHSGLREAVVEALPDPAGGKRLVAYVVPRGETAPDASALRSFLAEMLPPYMLPAAFITLTELPLTPNGKVDRRALPDPASIGVARERELAAPADPVEEIIAGIWAEVLGLPAVGVDQDFFEIGGHSLLATQVISRMTEALQVMIPLPRFFEEPTVKEQAALIRAARRQEDGQDGSGEIPPVLPVPRDRDLPLSFAQQRLWFIDQLEPGSAAYNIPAAVRLTGGLDLPAMERALQEVVQRHEALRTVFAARQGEPFQRIVPELRTPLPLADLAGLPETLRRQEVERLADAEAARPFDLAAGPLVRWTLLRLGPAERSPAEHLPAEHSPEVHWALVTMHHIVSDGWSAGIFLRELAALYEAGRRGEPSPLAPLPVQYADFAVWQRGRLTGETLEGQIAYWRRQLAGAPPRLELPTDRTRPAVQSFRGATLPVALPRGLAEDLATLGRRMGATPFMMLLAAFQALLSRLSGQEDVLVGSPIAGRNRREIEGLIGFFVNTLVLRGDLAGAPGFRQLVARVRATALAAYEHQDLPFERLVEELAPERSLAHSPLFQVAFALQNAPGGAFELPGLTLASLPTGGGVAKWDLTFTLGESADGDSGLTGSIAYSTDLFDRTTVMRWMEQLRSLLEDVVLHPDKGLPDLVLLPPAGRQQLLVEWSAEPAPELPDAPIQALFAAQVAQRPEAPAVVWDGGWMSYAELDGRARALAHHLRGLGAGPEVPVAFFLERSPEMVVTTLAILQAGGAYVPLDPAAPAERLSWMLADVGAPVLVTSRELLARLPGSAASVLVLEDLPAAGPAERLPRRTGGQSLAYVMYTSGSTGRPKGVAVVHRAVVRLVHGRFARFGPEQAWSQIAPVSFDAATLEIWGALLHGGRLVLLPDVPEPRALGEAVARLGITSLWMTTALFHQMVEENLAGLAPLTQLLSGGEVMSPVHVRRVLAAHPELRLVIAYGPTENTTFTTCDPLTGEAGREQVGETVPLGRPIAYTGVRVLDAALSPVPVGAAGELYVGGEGLARGYLGRPDLTAERFVPDPWAGPEDPGARLYRTGDRARWLADGRLDFLGRVDRQVKIRGFRIEPGEVEAALARHPGLREAVVEALPDPTGGRRLVAWAVPRDGEPVPSILELRAFLSTTLPAYMVPAAWVFLPELPLNANAKVDRRALPAPAAGAAIAYGDGAPAVPADPVEELLAGIWAEVLGLDRVGVHDDFFALGGHSLLATQVTSRIAAAFQVTLPLQQFFEAPTVAGQARLIQEARREEVGAPAAPPIVPVPRDGALPLSFAQQRLWFIDQLEPGGSAYNIPAAIHLEGRLGILELERALQEVVARHEALRTAFAAVEGEPFQRIEAEVRPPLPMVDLAGLPPETGSGEARRLAREEALRPFTLGRAPLIRWTLLRLRPEEHAALVTQHHIVSDGWSTGIFLRELAALYGALRRGEPSPLPELPVQYADFAAWQRWWLEGEPLERHLAYWRQRLAGAPPRLELPTDRPRPAVQTWRGDTLAFVLPGSLAAELAALGRKAGATLFMTLLAAFESLLARVTGQDDFLLGSPVAGRNRQELEGLIGFFVNTLVLRADTAGEVSFGDLLAKVRTTALEAYEHQDLPFERLVEELAPERSLAHSPLFQVVFALQNAPAAAFELPDLTLSPWPPGSGGAKFDITFALGESEAGLAGSIEYNPDLFDEATMVRLHGHFRNLLAGAVAAPQATVAALPLLGEAERAQLVREWNDTAVSRRPGLSLYGLFLESAALRPDAVAVSFEGASLTYDELRRRAGHLARRLHALGCGPEVVAAVALERSLELIVALLGILGSGAAYLPLDPDQPHARLSGMIEDARPAVLLTREELRPRLPEVEVPTLLLGGGEGPESQGQAAWTDLPPAYRADAAEDLQLAYVIFTSGSTGRPKASMLHHRGIVNRLLWVEEAYHLSPADAVLQKTPVTFDVSVWELFATLATGARMVLARPEGHRDPAYLADLIAGEGVSVLHFVPSMLRAYLDETELPRSPSVRLAVASGEALPADLVERFAGHFPKAALENLYGPTEASVDVTSWSCPRSGEGPVPIGRPLANCTIHLMDRQARPVPIGVTGELWIGGAGVGRGYLGRPDLTAERFVPDPFAVRGGRAYRTGDLARHRPDGAIEFLGRLDHQVKIRGFRVELAEVEAALALHPGVRDAVVGALPDPSEAGGLRLVAWVVAHEQEAPSPASLPSVSELRASLGARLPAYMVPSAWVFLPALPLTASGKVDRRALPAPEGRGAEAPFVEPRTPTERELAAIWREVLGVDRVGAEDVFFELGGHSLLATRAVARMRTAFHLDLSVRLLFDRPKLADLAAVIEQEQLSRAGAGELEDLLTELDLLSDEEAELELSAAGDAAKGGDNDG